MNQPIQIPRYVALVVESPLDHDNVKGWFRCVSDKAPYGVLTTIPTVDDKGEPQTVKLVHRETDKGHYYMVPVTRDLTDYEVERIVDAYADRCEHMDFDVEATVINPQPFEVHEPSITVEQQRYADLAVSWAKRQHDDWVQSRIDDGWRYGTEMSIEHKTHPLLRPWDELPDRYRKVDTDQPQKLLDLLGEHGYAVVSKPDLEAVLRLIRQL